MSDAPRVLIAGAGWRVSRFVVPALLAARVLRENITIVRKTPAESDGILAGLRLLLDPARAEGPFDLAINCVPAPLLLGMQRTLVELHPGAIHYCDTPIVHRVSDFFRARNFARLPNLFSLEDWPFMPNLAPMWEMCSGSPDRIHLRFEHIGIPNHFLSAARRAFDMAAERYRRLHRRRKNNLIERSRRTNAACVWQGPKNDAIAKISIFDGERLIEDFFELTWADEPDLAKRGDEVIWRRIEGDTLLYLLGAKVFHTVAIPAAITELYRGTRADVHELDKCAALVQLFRSALARKPEAYAFRDSVEDTLLDRASRRLGKLGVALRVSGIRGQGVPTLNVSAKRDASIP